MARAKSGPKARHDRKVVPLHIPVLLLRRIDDLVQSDPKQEMTRARWMRDRMREGVERQVI